MLPGDRELLNRVNERLQEVLEKLPRMEERAVSHDRTLDRLERMVEANGGQTSRLIEAMSQVVERIDGHDREIDALRRLASPPEEILALPRIVTNLAHEDAVLAAGVGRVEAVQQDQGKRLQKLDTRVTYWGGGLAVIIAVTMIVISAARFRIVGEVPPATTIILKTDTAVSAEPVEDVKP